jgi:hypothetical protein
LKRSCAIGPASARGSPPADAPPCLAGGTGIAQGGPAPCEAAKTACEFAIAPINLAISVKKQSPGSFAPHACPQQTATCGIAVVPVVELTFSPILCIIISRDAAFPPLLFRKFAALTGSADVSSASATIRQLGSRFASSPPGSFLRLLSLFVACLVLAFFFGLRFACFVSFVSFVVVQSLSSLMSLSLFVLLPADILFHEQ